jgi:hypothetical protein
VYGRVCVCYTDRSDVQMCLSMIVSWIAIHTVVQHGLSCRMGRRKKISGLLIKMEAHTVTPQVGMNGGVVQVY